MKFGKAIISPDYHNSRLISLRLESKTEKKLSEAHVSEIFVVEVLYNSSNKKIYKCPMCSTITGRMAPEHPENTSLFIHKYDCPNKGKIPIEA